jgi:hypothetical protein
MWGERSKTAYISFQLTETCTLAPVSPSRVWVIKDNLSANYTIDFFSNNFMRLGLTRAKAFQTISRLSRETRRRYAAPQSNSFALPSFAVNIKLAFFHSGW